jgi:general secretion pathway protein D
MGSPADASARLDELREQINRHNYLYYVESRPETQTVEYRDAGIILTVTPRIGEQGTVALDVKQEVNEVGENEPPPINSPRFTKREAETSVVLLNNQTLVLGGLIQNKRTRIRVGSRGSAASRSSATSSDPSRPRSRRPSCRC